MEETSVKVLGVISTTALFLVLGVNVPAFAQEKQPEAKPEKQAQQAKPAKQQAQAQPERQAKPAKQQAQAQPERQAKPAKQQAQAQPERQAKPAKQQAQAQPERQAKPAKQQAQAQPDRQARPAKQQQQAQAKPARQQQQGKQVTQQARGNGAGQQAGQQHAQRSAAEQQRQHAQPALRLSARSDRRIPDDRFRSNFGSEHRFRIGSPRMVDGYSRFEYGGFSFGFVQPWPVDWYYTDDVYVEYIDGAYYLCDPYYPGVHVGISVVL
jgi:hypothetical protein